MGERKYRADAIQIAAEACAGREFGRTVAVACAVPVIEGFVDEDEFGLDRGEDAGEAFILAVGGDEGVGGLVGDHGVQWLLAASCFWDVGAGVAVKGERMKSTLAWRSTSMRWLWLSEKRMYWSAQRMRGSVMTSHSMPRDRLRITSARTVRQSRVVGFAWMGSGAECEVFQVRRSWLSGDVGFGSFIGLDVADDF